MTEVDAIVRFLRESNEIEGIKAGPTDAQVLLFREFLKFDSLNYESVCSLVAAFQPGARLRTRPEDFVTIRGSKHQPPGGGMHIMYAFEDILGRISSEPSMYPPFYAHGQYESLHPFTDGNGRSGRAIYAWHCLRLKDSSVFDLGFLKHFYFAALGANHKYGEN